MGISIWFLVVLCVVVIVALIATDRHGDPVASRLQEMETVRKDAAPVRTAAGLIVPPSIPSVADKERSVRSRTGKKKPALRDRLIQAGWYAESSRGLFVVMRLVMGSVPIGIGIFMGMTGATTLPIGILLGAAVACGGTVAPSFILDQMKSARQKKIRRALPDALDVIVICLEGGLSLSNSFSRVATELAGVHPMLSLELKIVEREVRMGRSTGEAMKKFANRFDLEELRSMAAVINQAERFGSSVVQALTVYADSMRLKRRQHGEEMANKAAVKILFPTVLFIFPAMFVVLLGPAAIQIYIMLYGPDGIATNLSNPLQ